jgi:hypothetical protein
MPIKNTTILFDKDQKQEILFVALFAVICSYMSLKFNNDTYWILNSGKYVLENGIPYIEPFTIHEGLNFVMQQWLTACIFAFIFLHFGTVYLFILAYIIYLTITLIVYRFSMMVSNQNMPVSFLSTVLAIPGLYLFMVLRPSLFSILIFSIELFLIEKMVRTGKNKILIALPFLSVLLINLHAAMWPFFFIVFLPYFGELFVDRVIRRTASSIPGLWLGAAAVCSLLAGFINPYGLEGMTYLFRSYGHPYISAFISEMSPTSMMSANGIYFFCTLIVLIVVLSISLKCEIKLRYLFFALGTTFLVMTASRNLGLYSVCGIPMIAYGLQDFQWKEDEKRKTPKLRLLIVCIFIFTIVLTQSIRINDAIHWQNPDVPTSAVEYLISNEDVNSMRLYVDYNNGGYAEYRGLKPFIDARAEIFLKANNGKDEIFDDYVNVNIGGLYYLDFIKKYNLTHFLLSKGDLLDTYLSLDKNYLKIYEDDAFVIFKKK